MATENKVLTLEEVLVLPEGARVWVEVNEAHCNLLTNEDSGGVHQMYTTSDDKAMLRGNGYWSLASIDLPDIGWLYRVWSLPQPPTQEEMDAVPVVRCRDCRHSSKIANSTKGEWHCWSLRGRNNGDGFRRVNWDGYCDEGERMDADAPERAEGGGT